MAHRVVYERTYDAEVEYLESSGTQWIDTLYKMKLYDELRFKVQCLNDTNCAIFGSRGDTTLNFYQLYIDESATGLLAFGQHDPSTIFLNINSFQNNSLNEIIVKDGLCICNGVNTSIPLGVENSVQNLAIFARRNQDNTVSYPIKMILYYFKIYSNNVLVRDFIPVRKGNIGYLYDKISGKLFGNKGTGSFILGPDIAPVPNIRRVFRFDNKRFVAISND